jgi:GntR family transcriptional regulator / MocR family aminotransferase
MRENWATFGVDLHLELDATGGRQAALERALRDAIRAGRLASGARLPSTRALSAQLGLARGTVSAAYDQLVAEAYLLTRPGSGTVVADLSRQRPPAAIAPPPDSVAPRYDLRPGRPDVTSFPVSAWLRSTRRALAAAPAAAYDYGEPAGSIELRTALAEYLGRTRGVLASPGQIVITSGYVQALSLLTSVLGAGRAIAMEDPCLGFHRAVVRRAGARVVPVPVDGDGARTDLLPTTGAAAAVLTPAHQFPLGMTLHPRRRHAAIEWARTTGGVVIEDDYDGEFRYDRQPVGAMQGIAPQHVAYVGTASKTLGPALRLAWLVLPERLVEPVATAKYHADLHSEMIGQLTLADLIATHGYDRHVRACRLRYRRRRDLLVDRLAQLRHVMVDGIAAGLHAVIRLSGPTEQAVLAGAAAAGLAIGALRSHWHTAGDRPAGLVAGYGGTTDAAYPAALDVLVRVLRAAHGQATSGECP